MYNRSLVVKTSELSYLYAKLSVIDMLKQTKVNIVYNFGNFIQLFTI